MRGRQRGVAMLTAIILVALATIIAASVAFNNAMTARRGAAVLTFDQALLYAGGAEAVAAYALTNDGGSADHYGEDWAKPYGPLEIVPGVWLEARIEDPTGRFNINSLIDKDGNTDQKAVDIFVRLLESLDIDRKYAGLFADWIDVDISPNQPDGGEDTLYSARDPGYRPPNAPVTSTTELMALPDFDRETYDKMKNFVTALPREATINTCTASAEVLNALTGESFSQEGLLKSRQNGCFPQTSDLSNVQIPVDGWRISQKTDYFVLRSIVSIGTTEFALYSLLQRNGKKVSTILRTYGAD